MSINNWPCIIITILSIMHQLSDQLTVWIETNFKNTSRYFWTFVMYFRLLVSCRPSETFKLNQIKLNSKYFLGKKCYPILVWKPIFLYMKTFLIEYILLRKYFFVAIAVFSIIVLGLYMIKNKNEKRFPSNLTCIKMLCIISHSYNDGTRNGRLNALGWLEVFG